MTEMRKDRRAPVSLKVKFKSATVDEFIEQFGTDVSRGGIFIKTKKPLALGALLKFEFQLHGGQPVLHGVGRVAWRRLPEHIEQQGRPEMPLGMGIKFIKLDEPSRTIIERIEAKHELSGRAGSRFDQSDVAEIAPPLSSLPPPIALSPPPPSRASEGRDLATPLVPASLSPADAARANGSRPVRAGQSSPPLAAASKRPSNGLTATFRPPPPAHDSVPPLRANTPLASGAPARASVAAQAPAPSGVALGGTRSVPSAAASASAPHAAPKRPTSKAVAPAIPAASRAYAAPSGAAHRPAAPSARSAAGDTSEFLASAISVGGVGREVRSQAQAQAERARRDPQSVELANELFGDLSDNAARAPDPALDELPAAPAESKPLSAQEQAVAETIPTLEDLENEPGQATGHAAPHPGVHAGSLPPSAAMPSLSPRAASARPHAAQVPDEVPLSLELGPGSLNIASEAPRPVARKRRSALPLVFAALAVAGAAAGAFVFLRPALQQAPSSTAAVPAEAHASAPNVAPAAEPAEANPAAPAVNPDSQAPRADVSLPISTTPAGAEVVVDGQVAGKTPTTVTLHGGATVELRVRLAGYITKTEHLAVAAGLAPRDIALQPMPYVLAITTDPPGATISVGSQTVESPAPLELEHVSDAVQVNIQLQGYTPATRSVRVEDFREHEGVLRAELTQKLAPQALAHRKVPVARVVRNLEPPAPSEGVAAHVAPPEPPAAAPEPEAAPAPAAPKPAEPAPSAAPTHEAANAPPPSAAAAPAVPAAPAPAKEPKAEPSPAPAAPAPEPAAQ